MPSKHKQTARPLVVADTSWAQSIPEWLIAAIKAERVLLSLVEIKDGTDKQQVGNAEALAWVMTASNAAPLHGDMVEIMIWLTATVMKQHKPDTVLCDFMQEKLVKGLSRDEERELIDLKGNLYRKRGGAIRSDFIDAFRQLRQEVS